MGVEKALNSNSIRVSVLCILCSAAFFAGLLHTGSEQETTPIGEQKPRNIAKESTKAVALEKQSDRFQRVFQRLENAFESEYSFDIQYTALQITQEFEPIDLLRFLQFCSRFESSDANVVRLCLGLDIAYRNPSLLKKLISTPESLEHVRLDIH